MYHKRWNTLCAFILCAVLSFSLCSCSSPAPKTPEPTPTEHVVAPPSTSAPDYVPTPTETAQPTPEQTPEQQPTQQPTTPPTTEPTAAVQPTPTVQVTTPPESGSTTIDTSSPAVLGETADMGQDYVDKIIFLGDSTTYGLKYYAILSGGKETRQVWTPASGTLTLSNQSFATIVYPPTGEEIPIRDAVELEKPAMMVITLGVNGVSFMDKDYFISEYSSLVNDIKTISPDTKVILQSIFPVASNYEYLKSINNTNIGEANKWVLKVAEDTGCRYLNTASVLLGSDGWLPQSYHNGDGLHLNETSFGIVINYIRTHGLS